MGSLSWQLLKGSGATYANEELSDQARFIAHRMMTLYDLVDPAQDFYLNRKSGDTIAYRVVGRIPGTADTPLHENQKIPMAKPPYYEGSSTVYRRGIAVPWTGVFEDLDRLDVEDTVIHALKEHSARTHNLLIYNALRDGRSFTYVAKTANTNDINDDGTVTDTAAAPYSGWHARRVKLHMTRRNTPFADGKNYFAAVSPVMYNDLFDDTGAGGFIDIAKYTSAADGLLEGEAGKYMNVRYVVDNDVLPDAIGTGAAYGSGFFVGWEACKEVPVYPMHLLANTNLGGDFGSQKAVAWVSMLAFKTVWIYSAYGQGSVLHYTSA